MQTQVALIGFGEAASTFARVAGWAKQAAAFDLDLRRTQAMRVLGICDAGSAEEALIGAPLILSLVSADQALAAARNSALNLMPGAVWCDMNSVAPDTKRAAAQVITAAGGRYVDAAIMAPVDPAHLAVPVLLSGADAQDAQRQLGALGFSNTSVVGQDVGKASAIKMIRSVMVKGIEALTDEMMAAAAAAGVAEEVLASLDASEKSVPWSVRAAYNLERMATHGARRAAEMEESAKTLQALGIRPVMTNGTVLRQRGAASDKDRAA